jgi:hypothetical protein
MVPSIGRHLHEIFEPHAGNRFSASHRNLQFFKPDHRFEQTDRRTTSFHLTTVFCRSKSRPWTPKSRSNKNILFACRMHVNLVCNIPSPLSKSLSPRLKTALGHILGKMSEIGRRCFQVSEVVRFHLLIARSSGRSALPRSPESLIPRGPCRRNDRNSIIHPVPRSFVLGL